ncbi:MAG: hypothetical protein HKN77_08190 [Woeseiaceae bacterium]|nr:hypothetical protein [Woeseiaceae bacterium]
MSFDIKPGRIGLFVAMATLSATIAFAETEFTVNGIDVDSAVVDAYIETRTQQPASQADPAARAQWIEELTDLYLLTTQARVKELAADPKIQAQLELQKRGLLAQVAASDFIARNAATDEEILAEYKTQIEQSPDQQFKARHILVEAQSTAVDLIGELKGGADFEELAKANSTGPSGPNGGDLGWFASNQMVKPFADAVAALEDGAYTQAPVQTQFGWHVILREDSRDAEPPTLDAVRDVVKQQVEQQKLQLYLEQLRELNSK